MITSARAEKLVVISDLHLGNPFSRSKKKAIAFLKWAASQGYDICINGDGLEIAQASFQKLASDIPDIVRALKHVQKSGRSIYYAVGNHDIALEHFLEDWGPLTVCPFLNLRSGNARIRIEHGHLYDPFFVRSPNLYEFLTHMAGFLLKVSPNVYRLWIAFERFKARLRARRTGIVGEPVEFAEAAYELTRRGFDAVIFGHTHHAGEFLLENNTRYLNPGSWLLSSHYVEINAGQVVMKEWEPRS